MGTVKYIWLGERGRVAHRFAVLDKDCVSLFAWCAAEPKGTLYPRRKGQARCQRCAKGAKVPTAERYRGP